MTEVEREPSDEVLMCAYVAGDQQAFAALFQRLAPRVHAFFARSFGSTSVADDLLQTTFLKIHAARASFRPDARVRPWVFGIATRVRFDRLRGLYRLPPNSGEEALEHLASSAIDPAAALDAGRVEDQVRAAVDALPEGQRVVVHLHHFEGLSLADVAEVLGLEPGTVRVRAFRAYAVLRRTLDAIEGRSP